MSAHAEQDLLLDLAYGELSDREAGRVRAHLTGCAACRDELDRIEGTRKLFSALPEVPAPERGERILLAAAREAADRARQPVFRLPRWLVPAAALAATVAVVSAVTLRGTGGGPAGLLQGKAEQEGIAPAPVAAAPAPAGGAETASDEAEVAREKKAAEEPSPAAGAPGGGRRPAESYVQAPAQAERRSAAKAGAAGAASGAKRENALAAPERYARAPAAEAPPPPAAPPPAALRAAPRPAESADRAEAAKAAPDARFDAGDDLADGEVAVADVGEGVVGGVASAPAGAAAAERPAKRAAPARSREADATAAAEGRDEDDRARSAGPATAPLVQDFPGCAAETRREIERDAGGRVIRYAREGVAEGRRVRVELRFAADGRLVSAKGRDLASGAPLPADVLPGLPRSAAQVDPAAPAALHALNFQGAR